MARRAFTNSNPALSDAAFERIAESEAGWAAATQQRVQEDYAAPPVTRTDTMTVSGTVWATAALLVLVVGAGIYGWNSVDTAVDNPSIPGWTFLVMLVGFGVAMVTCFKPALARFTAPLYALLEGAFLGVISKLYNDLWNGIAYQAVALTIGVFAVMLFLYGTRIIKVTEKLRMGIVAATAAVCLVYVVNLVFTLFGAHLPYLHQTGAIGIAISLAIVGVAAFNLLLDFDFVERGVAAGAPAKVEWYAAFGLLVTIVWLYLELLRLLAILQGRD
ncbi:MAG: Bax inhibitor-1/YccA family protein [Acidimicrobiales bacterium]